MKTRRAILFAAAAVVVSAKVSQACENSTIPSFMLNLTGATGSSSNSTINAAVSTISADVTQVRYDSSNSYINATGIPSYPVGPFPGNPNTPSNQNWLYKVPLTPTVQSGTKTATGLGAIGFCINGVPFFNAKDANSYNNKGIWHQDANVVEASSFDSGKGHPQQSGVYHYHQSPPLLRSQLGDDGTHHSPLLGFAFDGFPVYGPYGYANADGSGGAVRMDSSYQLRSITQRHTLADGTNLTQANWGPDVSTTYPLGYYIEDYQYVSGLGQLNDYNMRFSVTPEFPEGTWAYFTTLGSSGAAAYPYIVGPNYYGVLQTDDVNRTVTVPSTGVTTFNPATSATWNGSASGEWCDATNWSGGKFPSGTGTAATFATIASSTASIGNDEPRRVGTMQFTGTTNYTISGTGQLTFLAVSPATASVTVSSGTQTISTPVVIGTPTTFNVSDNAQLNITNLLSTASTITKTGNGTLQLNRLSGTTLTLSGGTLAIPAGASVGKLSSATISGAKLDLTDSDLILTSMTRANVETLLQNGYNHGNWQGSGIMSSIAAANSASGITALGVAQASDGSYTSFGGQSVATSDILVKYTYAGDSNLDGKVTFDDFQNFLNGFNGTSSARWFTGDFNYSGAVTFDDFQNFLIGFGAYNSTGTTLSTMDRAQLASFSTEIGEPLIASQFEATPAPEPSAIAFAVASTLLLRRRTRFISAV